MPDWLNVVLSWLALPDVGLPALFVVAFVSATLFPLATEPALFAFVKVNPDQFWLAIVVASVGNTAGGMVTYWMGLGAKNAFAHDKNSRHFGWLQRLGAPVLLISWMPVVGDVLCAMAGWLKLPWRGVLFWMALGKFLRFLIATVILLWIPDRFWAALWAVFS